MTKLNAIILVAYLWLAGLNFSLFNSSELAGVLYVVGWGLVGFYMGLLFRD